MTASSQPDESEFPVAMASPRDEPTPALEAEFGEGGVAARDGPTLLLDWDRERYAGAVPRRIPLPLHDAGPTWLAFPHHRYVICARHAFGRIEHIYVTSLVGRRDSLIPAGVVERVVCDDRSVTVVVDGKPFLYAVEAGTTTDLTARRVMGTTQA